jgi:hypothetical protein
MITTATPTRHPSSQPLHAARARIRGAHPRRLHGGPALAEPSADSTLDRQMLGGYADAHGRARELLARPAPDGGTLIVDRYARTLGDARLVAHLASDEPRENAEIVCQHYLSDPLGRWCRPVMPDDLTARDPARRPESTDAEVAPFQRSDELVDRAGHAYRLGLVASRLAIPELRWLALPLDAEIEEAKIHGAKPQSPRPLSVREVIACLESYEPARALTARALDRHREDLAVSVAVLRAELARIDASRIVLNRGLRMAVMGAVERQGLSMSEIAIRCGRVKHDARGNASGETSWLARRIGAAPEGGESTPTPWIHSEVLALIARAGLGISPREVELG